MSQPRRRGPNLGFFVCRRGPNLGFFVCRRGGASERLFYPSAKTVAEAAKAYATAWRLGPGESLHLEITSPYTHDKWYHRVTGYVQYVSYEASEDITEPA